MINPPAQFPSSPVYGKGKSKAAAQRRANATRGTLHQAKKPGQVIEMFGGRKYVVAQDGSFRRIVAAKFGTCSQLP